jgi:hypothetical protein
VAPVVSAKNFCAHEPAQRAQRPLFEIARLSFNLQPFRQPSEIAPQPYRAEAGRDDERADRKRHFRSTGPVEPIACLQNHRGYSETRNDIERAHTLENAGLKRSPA